MGVDFCGVDRTGVLTAALLADEDIFSEVSRRELKLNAESKSVHDGRDQGLLLHTTRQFHPDLHTRSE